MFAGWGLYDLHATALAHIFAGRDLHDTALGAAISFANTVDDLDDLR